MIIFQGWGLLVVIIAGLAMGLSQIITGSLVGDPNYFVKHNWPFGVGLLLASIAIYCLGRYLNSRPGKVMIDKATGREFVLRQRHTLFFIPMQYWAIILALLGVAFFFIQVK